MITRRSAASKVSIIRILYLNIVNNQRNSLPHGAKPIINVSNIKMKKNDLNNELKTKGRKLNLRFKDFAQKKRNMLENNISSKINHTFQSDEKSKKPNFLQVKTSNCEYNNVISQVNKSDYSTNNMVVHPKRNDKVQNSLFKINQRRCMM
jgi:hypothetical protein